MIERAYKRKVTPKDKKPLKESRSKRSFSEFQKKKSNDTESEENTVLVSRTFHYKQDLDSKLKMENLRSTKQPRQTPNGNNYFLF